MYIHIWINTDMRILNMYDKTHSYGWHDRFIRVPCLMHTREKIMHIVAIQ